ncbi:MAG: hypothetical protein H6810_08060 [Phycisphaeraceae bacterium]|nr:MAG: hypothetical protein H6810_08060 [Phycisphaeraceae bacterium]
MIGLFGAVVVAAITWPTPVAVHDDGTVGIVVDGFRTRIKSELIDEPELCARVLDTLTDDLARIDQAVPAPPMAALRGRVVIWIEKQGATVPGGMSGRGMVYHPSGEWLEEHGLDPARAHGVEIVRARDFLDWRREQPMMLLHELAHAYHHLIGLENASVTGAYEAARASGDYDSVGYVLDKGGEGRPAYAMNNPTEYFSELTEAYFGRNDYEPFDREGLKAFDPRGYEMIKQAWGMDGAALEKLAGE